MNVKKLIKQNGVKRVSKGAIESIESQVLDLIKEISFNSARLADHAGRKTVTEEDVKLALLVGR